MDRRRLTIVVLGLAGLLAGCAEDPYVRSDYRIHQRGAVYVCHHDDDPPEQVYELADKICRQYDRMAYLALTQAFQCSWAAPTLSTFTCGARPGENPAPIIKKNNSLRHEVPLQDK